MTELHKLTVRELVAGVREKRWSESAVIRAVAAQIAARDRDIQAWEHLDVARAMDCAERADAGAAQGSLQGVPVAVKDIIDVAGMPTRYGSPIYAPAGPAARPPGADRA